MSTPYQSVWERPDPATRSFTRDEVVRAAWGLADEGGLDAVSMRNVASRLGVGPMRLYRVIATKDELLDLVVDAGYGEVLAALGRRRTAVAVARSIREVVLAHPWLADLLGGRPALGPHSLAVLELEAAAFERTTSGPDAVAQAMATMRAYVVGAVRQEVADARAAAVSGVDEQAWQAAVGPYLARTFAAGRHSALQRVVTQAREVSPQRRFERGLTAVLAALGEKG